MHDDDCCCLLAANGADNNVIFLQLDGILMRFPVWRQKECTQRDWKQIVIVQVDGKVSLSSILSGLHLSWLTLSACCWWIEEQNFSATTTVADCQF